MEQMEEEMRLLRLENSNLKAAHSDSVHSSGSGNGKAIAASSIAKQVTATSLLTGMPVLHGIGCTDLTTEENLTFNKWYRQTEKLLTSSRVKVFNGTGWITWKQMILRDIILNQLKDVLLEEMRLEDV
jgi:hypothetical protein